MYAAGGRSRIILAEYGIAHFFNPIVFPVNTAGANPTRQFFIMPPAWRTSRPANVSMWAIASPGISWERARRAFGLAIQIRNDFKHGEVDEGATPDAVIEEMTELLDILEKDQVAGAESRLPAASQCCSMSAHCLFDAGDILYYRPERGCKFAEFLQELGLDTSTKHDL